MKNALLGAALSYREQGWSVIPISASKKIAKVKWKAFQQRRASPDEIRSWWERWPNARVGLVTGRISNLVVVDVDPDRGGDANGWSEQQPTEYQVRTRRGGRHFYYVAPKDSVVRNSVDRIAAGIDVRGEGGYVVAPPSAGYEWQGRHPASATLRSGDGPPMYRDHVRFPTRRQRSDEQWLERTLQGVAHGERNDACARLAGYYVKQRIPADVIIAQLLAWNKLNDPPLAESEIRTTVESVSRTAADRRVHSGSRTFELVGDKEGFETEGPADSYELTPFASYMSKYGSEPVSWLVKDWLPEQTVGMVIAPPGSYKTWLLQDLAVSVASGLPFLGQFPVLKKGPVLFMQQEDWHGQVAHRFALIVARRAGLTLPRMEGSYLHVHCPPQLPIFLHEHRSFRFDDEQVVDAWVEKIKQVRPALVILDPLYSAGSVEDFMAGTAREMFLFKSVRDALGTTFLIAHHTRKSARLKETNGGKYHDDAAEREDVWGSQFLNAWLETGWQVRRREELGTASIARHFKVQSEAPRAILGFNIDTTQIPGRYEVSVQEVKPGQKEDGADLMQILEKRGGVATVAQLVSLSGLHRSTVFRRMENLVGAGVVQRNAKGYQLLEFLNAS